MEKYKNRYLDIVIKIISGNIYITKIPIKVSP